MWETTVDSFQSLLFLLHSVSGTENKINYPLDGAKGPTRY